MSCIDELEEFEADTKEEMLDYIEELCEDNGVNLYAKENKERVNFRMYCDIYGVNNDSILGTKKDDCKLSF